MKSKSDILRQAASGYYECHTAVVVCCGVCYLVRHKLHSTSKWTNTNLEKTHGCLDDHCKKFSLIWAWRHRCTDMHDLSMRLKREGARSLRWSLTLSTASEVSRKSHSFAVLIKCQLICSTPANVWSGSSLKSYSTRESMMNSYCRERLLGRCLGTFNEYVSLH